LRAKKVSAVKAVYTTRLITHTLAPRVVKTRTATQNSRKVTIKMGKHNIIGVLLDLFHGQPVLPAVLLVQRRSIAQTQQQKQPD